MDNKLCHATKINKKNVIKIDEEGKITIKPQLLRSMSTRSEWGEGSTSVNEENKEEDTMSIASEMSRMSFEPARHSVMEICYEATKTNPNSIYIPIKICLEDIIHMN